MKLKGKYKIEKRTYIDSVKNCLDGINHNFLSVILLKNNRR